MKQEEFVHAVQETGVYLHEHEPLYPYTTFRIGGEARFFARPNTAAQMSALLKAADQFAIPCVVIGNGSNLLVSDDGYPGLVIRSSEETLRLLPEQTVCASAGVPLARVAAFAAQNALTGLEFAQGIPGTVGGGVLMNAGAYGGQVSDVLLYSEYLDESREIQVLQKQAHAFGYRESYYKHHPRCIVTSAAFRLKVGDPQKIAAVTADYSAKRRAKQPLECPSAGSVYKRPEGCFAGKLIEDCGLKGYCVGGAQVSEKHAGFIINRGSATCQDVLQLMEHIENTVFERYGVRLEREVRLLK